MRQIFEIVDSVVHVFIQTVTVHVVDIINVPNESPKSISLQMVLLQRHKDFPLLNVDYCVPLYTSVSTLPEYTNMPSSSIHAGYPKTIYMQLGGKNADRINI